MCFNIHLAICFSRLSVNSPEMKKSASLLLSFAPPLRQLWKKLICGNRGVAEGTATSSQISHNILSQTEPNMFIPLPPSNMEFLLKFLDLQNIFWTCSPNCSSWAGGWALVAEVWSHTLFSTCVTRQQMLCSLLLFSTAQFWLLYFSRCWICLVSLQ